MIILYTYLLHAKTWLCHQAIRAPYFVHLFTSLSTLSGGVGAVLFEYMHVDSRDQRQVFASIGLSLLSANSLGTGSLTEPEAYQFS